MHRCVGIRSSQQIFKGFIYRLKSEIDHSRVPVIGEADIEENFVRGSGPGGQHVNKTSSCVVLKHLPTGIVVKCHQTRYQQQNRKIARGMLLEKVDDALNGEMSVSAQTKRIEAEKNRKREIKAKRLRELKSEFKKSQSTPEPPSTDSQ